jgi:hypothetical protein
MRDDHMKSAVTKPKPLPEAGACARPVPVDSTNEPFYGCMKGLATIHGNVTKPVDVEWKALK